VLRLDPIPCVNGLHLADRIRSGSARVERDIAELAKAADVGFDRLSNYCVKRAEAGLSLDTARSPPRTSMKG